MTIHPPLPLPLHPPHTWTPQTLSMSGLTLISLHSSPCIPWTLLHHQCFSKMFFTKFSVTCTNYFHLYFYLRSTSLGTVKKGKIKAKYCINYVSKQPYTSIVNCCHKLLISTDFKIYGLKPSQPKSLGKILKWKRGLRCNWEK